MTTDLMVRCGVNAEMAKAVGATDYYRQLGIRTRALRERTGMTQVQMATALGVDKERYAKYETRSPLPHDLIERFCLIAGCTIEELITGKGRRAGGRRTADATVSAA